MVIAFPIGKTAEDVDGNSAWQRLSATEDGRSFVMLEELVPMLEEHTS